MPQKEIIGASGRPKAAFEFLTIACGNENHERAIRRAHGPVRPLTDDDLNLLFPKANRYFKMSKTAWAAIQEMRRKHI